jgi:hypothetical protein
VSQAKSEKFDSEARFHAARLRGAALRAVIGPLADWTPLESPRPGYSVVIGCSADLVPILQANLQMLTRQRRENLDRVILVFDRTAEAVQGSIEPRLRERYGAALPLSFVYYNDLQDRVLGTINWGWTYCWMNWVLGVAASRTRHVLIHDLDAMLVRPDLLESRYAAAHNAGAAFCGTSCYHTNGISRDDRLLTTFEMVCDVAHLRARFRPIDCYNLPARWKGRRVEFDTWLWPQKVSYENGARGLLLPVDLEDMVHPSQMICQYMDVRFRQRYVPPANNNILMIPYFMELGGDRETLCRHQAALDASDGRTVACFGRPTDFRHFAATHAAWLTEQGHRLDRAVHGRVRPEIEHYFASITSLAARRATALDARPAAAGVNAAA